MKKEKFIRLSGWLLKVGAVIFLPGGITMLFWNTDVIRSWNPFLLQIAAFGAFWAPILWALGILGLWARNGNEIGNPWKGILVFGTVIGSIIVIVGNLGQMFAPVYSISITYYGVWAWGVFILLACLSIFGIFALAQKPPLR